MRFSVNPAQGGIEITVIGDGDEPTSQALAVLLMNDYNVTGRDVEHISDRVRKIFVRTGLSPQQFRQEINTVLAQCD